MRNRQCLCCAIQLAILLLIPFSSSLATLQFGLEHRVSSSGSAISVSGYSVPAVADWNEDGLKDLIVGEGTAFFDGKVRIYLNIGSNQAPEFAGFVYAQQETGDLVWVGG